MKLNMIAKLFALTLPVMAMTTAPTESYAGSRNVVAGVVGGLVYNGMTGKTPKT